MINKTTNILHKKLNKIKQKNLSHKLDNILKAKDLSTKIIYKIIKNKPSINEINYYIDNSANPPKLVTDPNLIKKFIENKFLNTFNNVTQEKNISIWLNDCPIIKENYKETINFSVLQITKTLTTRQNSAPGIDKIHFDMFKFLKSNNSIIFKLISKLYTSIYRLHYIPISWKKGITSLIPKADSTVINNWRPITLLNTLYKGFTLIINYHLQKSLTDNQIIPPEQCGFNKNQDTSIAITAYIESIKKSITTKSPLHVLYIDFKAAFDSVQHWVLKSIMNHIKLDNNLKKMIENIMSNSHTNIKTIKGMSTDIPINTGVKQGDPLSPTLFLLYLILIQWHIKKTFPNNIYNFNHLCYADDMILLAQNRPQLTLMLNNLITYCNFTDMNINEKKSIYSYTNDHPQPPMTINTLTPMNQIKTPKL